MKTKSILLFIGFIGLNTYSQIAFQDHIITTNVDLPTSIHLEDLDGDGDLDVLSSSNFDNKIAWYENTDGQGNFGPQQIISLSAMGAEAVYAKDIDGDGDMDVLSASLYDFKVAWYENTNGLGNFGPAQIITAELGWANSVYACDFDGDGDMDVLSSQSLDFDYKIVWYENLDGLGNFGIENIITTFVFVPTSVYACDIDGDGDMDVLSSSWHDNKIAWYENEDGLGTFGPQRIISTNINQASSVYASDIDGDGDLDVLSASNWNGKISHFQNLDGKGNFGLEVIITTSAEGVTSIYSCDIDGDNDMDVISGSQPIQWYENSNGGSDWSTHLITEHINYAYRIYSNDVDGDGDMDILSTPHDMVSWHENLGVLGYDENKITRYTIYPIPTSNSLFINSETPITQIEIYNLLGQLVKSNTNQNSIDISSVDQGVYFVKVIDENGNIGTQKVMKR